MQIINSPAKLLLPGHSITERRERILSQQWRYPAPHLTSNISHSLISHLTYFTSPNLVRSHCDKQGEIITRLTLPIPIILLNWYLFLIGKKIFVFVESDCDWWWWPRYSLIGPLNERGTGLESEEEL